MEGWYRELLILGTSYSHNNNYYYRKFEVSVRMAADFLEGQLAPKQATFPAHYIIMRVLDLISSCKLLIIVFMI